MSDGSTPCECWWTRDVDSSHRGHCCFRDDFEFDADTGRTYFACNHEPEGQEMSRWAWALREEPA